MLIAGRWPSDSRVLECSLTSLILILELNMVVLTVFFFTDKVSESDSQ